MYGCKWWNICSKLVRFLWESSITMSLICSDMEIWRQWMKHDIFFPYSSVTESEPQSSFSKERSVLKSFPSQIFFLLGFTKHTYNQKIVGSKSFLKFWNNHSLLSRKYLNKSICRVKYWNTVLTFENGGKSMGIGKKNIKLIFWNKLCRAVLIIF